MQQIEVDVVSGLELQTLIRDLNPQQRLALEHLNGPLLILAGAGSGKTRVLTYRIAALILAGYARPGEIWATTFTNKAAEEMRSRVRNLLQTTGAMRGESPWVSTFHSAGAEILRRYGSVMGLAPRFSIYDEQDQLSLIKKIMVDLNLSEKQWNPKMFRGQIDQLKNRGVAPLAFSKMASTFDKEIVYRVYDVYQKVLRASQALDFGDLLMEAVRLVREYPEVKAQLQSQYKYFLVDEFQDTNPIQYQWIRLLSDHTRHLCVVGDEDQSIYGWRGADIWNILNFQKDYADATVIKLEQNYRSTRTIVSAASRVIANNAERTDKKLFSEAGEGEAISLEGVYNEQEEADRVVAEIRARVNKGIAYADQAVFYRTNAQSRVIEERLRANRIPYQVYGGLKFYDRAEVKDALAYFRLCANPYDDVAFTRAVSSPPRGVGKASIQKLIDARGDRSISLLECAAQEGILSGKARVGILSFLDLINEMSYMAREERAPSEIYRHWWAGSGYIEMLRKEDSIESQSRLENLAELENGIREYMSRVTTPTLAGFLDEIALVTDRPMEETEQGVSLMTLHSSKGLEFDVVYLVGLEEGLFPSQRAIEENHVEEERRLFYVGMTRARQKLYLYFAHNRMSYGVLQPRLTSRFIEEVPAEYLSVSGSSARRPKHSIWDMDEDGLPVIENRAERKVTGPAALYRQGMRVRHHEYGVGIIRRCDGTSGNERLVVQFEHFGERRFMAKYAQLEVLWARS